MKCKQVQMLMAADGALTGEAKNHVGACRECQSFLRDVTALQGAIPSLDVALPADLRGRIRNRVASPRAFDWRSLAISMAIAAVIVAPVAQVVAKRMTRQYVKGDRIGTLPPFHAKLYGKDHMNIGMEAMGDVWFSGYAVRLTTSGFDSIDSFEKGIGYQHWKPDGILQKRVERWAKSGKPVTLAERILLLEDVGPAVPSYGIKKGGAQNAVVTVFGHEYKTLATTYRLPVSKEGSLTSVQTPTDAVVYKDSDTGQIVRVELVATFPNGVQQTETHDFEFVMPSEEKFETATLRSIPQSMPATQVPAKAENRPGP